MKKTLITLTLISLSTMAMADAKHDKMDMNHGSKESSTNSMTMDHSNGMSMEGMSDVGMPAMGSKPNKVVHVILSDDMKITFKKEVDIDENDVVQFVIMNTGKIDHEFTIGSMTEQMEHREMMKKMGGHAHDSANAVTVKPGKAKQLLWHFQGGKNVEFACNIPGHAEAGMVKSITL